MKKTLSISLLFAAIIFFVFSMVMTAVRVDKMVHFADREELNSFDFNKNCAVVEEPFCERYVNRLLKPEEIAAALPDDPGAVYDNVITYRFTVPVTEGVNYGISCRKSDYAVNVYVDGVPVVRTGHVADNAEEFVPTAAAYEAFFTGKGDRAEIVIWQANFNHHKHYPLWFRLGPAEQISDYNRKVLLESVIIAVILLTSAFMNLGLFLCFPVRRELLWFFIICFMASISTVFPDVSCFITPNINWYVSHKLEICSIIVIFIFSVLYVGELFERYVNRKLFRLALVVSGLIFALFAFTPSYIYSRCNEVCLVIVAVTAFPMLVSMIVKMIRRRKGLPKSNILALTGVAVYGLISLNEAIGYGDYLPHLDIIGTTTGVAFFTFFNSLALSIDFRSSLDMLAEAESREKELDRTNRMLTRLDRLRETFLSDLSHELKTPLTVIASNAAVSARQVSMGKADEATAVRLGNIEREAVRLGKMVEKMKNSAKEQYSEEASDIYMGSVLDSTADFCMPLCARNDNTIEVECERGIKAFTSENTLFHCLYNLISNATKHSRESVIEVRCTKGENGVVVSVCDHGEGMTDEQKNHAFERGYSGDSSTGIGLPLCRELVENEGGTIFLSDTPGGGLTVSFILKEARGDGKDTDDRG